MISGESLGEVGTAPQSYDGTHLSRAKADARCGNSTRKFKNSFRKVMLGVDFADIQAYPSRRAKDGEKARGDRKTANEMDCQ